MPEAPLAPVQKCRPLGKSFLLAPSVVAQSRLSPIRRKKLLRAAEKS